MTTPILQGAQWIFFDVGSTLLDETECLKTRFSRAAALAADFGVATSDEELWHVTEQAYTACAPSPFMCALAQLPLTRDQKQVVYDGSPYQSAGESPYEGIVDLLTHLHKSHSLGVLANQAAGLVGRLRNLGLNGYFRCILGSGDLGLAKPDPKIFELAAREADARPESIIMVGDRIDNDIVPARALGWRTVRVRQGIACHQSPRSPAETADCELDAINQLTGLL
jgi:HAD superfamily hydrolase (TIGR01509 family)